ncbi:MAG: carbohydrate binding domain-containing protein [Thermoproteota archaeon]|nr:carbohydrate binding domain-containing protein [Candidatus Brockarchaeota archaeon]
MGKRSILILTLLLAIIILLVFSQIQVLLKNENLGGRVFPFYLPWDDGEETIVSMNSRKPAGSLGHVHVGRDGHLYVGGERIKFLGVNICGGAAFPEKDEAERIAARLAKFGVNAVRFHHMDASWESFNIFDRSAGGTRKLNDNALDKLDYFIHCLKENGIYIDLNLLVSRRFTIADGLPSEIELVDWKEQQILGFFMEEVESLEKEYATQLLTHFNPYTGMAYGEDPAVAFVEIVNEQGLIHSWLDGAIDRLPQTFKDALKEKWNNYLLSKYGSDENLRKAWATPISLSQSTELLKNGRFENGLDSWVIEVHDGAEASYRIVTEAGGRIFLEIAVKKKGLENWHVQFNQPGLRIAEGETYLVRFGAKADRNVRVSIGLVQAHEPWGWLSQRVDITLTRDWEDYEIALLASQSEENARLDISGLGANIATYQFSCFSMKRFSGYGLMNGESLSNKTVQIFPVSEYNKRSPVAKNDWIEFLYFLEESFFTEMYHFIKEELGVKALVIGTTVGCSTPNIMAKLDIVDTHAYWMHPWFPGIPWDPANWYVINEPMVNNPQGSTITGLAVKRVYGKPHFVTEYNHPSPNMYDAETALTLATYAALQDWDGVFLFDYGARGDWDSKRIRGFFNIDQHPVKMATLIPAHLIFVRGDVKPAERLVTVKMDSKDEIMFIAGGKAYAWMLPDGGTAGLNPLLSLIHKTAVSTENAFNNDTDFKQSQNTYSSDTGEIIWDVSDSRGLILVNTSRSIAIIGFSGGRTLKFCNIIIEVGETLLDGWCVITLSTLDNENSSASKRMLLIATGYTTNTGMRLRTYEEGRSLLTWSRNFLTGIDIYKGPVTCGVEWGYAPTVTEGIPGTIRIRTDMDLEVWALDNMGRRTSQVKVVDEGEYKVFKIGPEYQTIWYELALSTIK